MRLRLGWDLHWDCLRCFPWYRRRRMRPGWASIRRRSTRTARSSTTLLYLPPDYGKDEAKKWPLIVFLHGSGERGTDVEPGEAATARRRSWRRMIRRWASGSSWSRPNARRKTAAARRGSTSCSMTSGALSQSTKIGIYLTA